jgi:cellulose synthase/poly-beta-1,6-N-acetylglucosamine synthase-like glycosyltransferase
MNDKNIVNNLVLNVEQKKVLKGVSLISTVYNEGNNISVFLESIKAQSLYPEELIIVDGGSTDETIEVITNFISHNKLTMNVRLIIDPTCNLLVTHSPIAKGRNRAIKEAAGKIIACTDAGCTIDKKWLEKITWPFLFDNTVDVVGGWYLPDTKSFFEKCMAIVFLLPPSAVNGSSFTPSARSLAFKKSVWEKVGGFPEISYTAEDTAFIINLRKMGLKFKYVPDALVYWRMRSNFRQFIKLIYKYGYGDGFTSILLINVFKNVFKIAILVILILLVIIVSKAFVFLLLVYLWMLPFNKRFGEAIKADRIFRLPILIFLRLSADVTYIIGYVVGKIKLYCGLKQRR